jgi:hypothetical protein
MAMVYHQSELPKEAQGVAFDFKLDRPMDTRQAIVRSYLDDELFVKSLHVEPIKCQ